MQEINSLKRARDQLLQLRKNQQKHENNKKIEEGVRILELWKLVGSELIHATLKSELKELQRLAWA